MARKPWEPDYEIVAPTPMRQAIGERTQTSIRDLPQFDATRWVNAQALVEDRAGRKSAGADPLPSHNDYLLKLCGLVLEEMPLKKKVFGEVEEFIGDDTILATNTSSLSITEMAADLKKPERVVGFHFFNPVAVMPLLEIVKGKKTDDVTLSTAFAMGKKIKKTSILMNDSPAFLVNRLLTRWMAEIMKIVDESKNDFKQIDDYCVSLGFPMTPFSLLALVGPAVALHVAETLKGAFGDRFYISEGFKKMVELKKPGVYDWEGNVDPEVASGWPRGDKEFTQDEVIDRFLTALTEECRMILDEGVVSDAKDIDTCMIMGAGWPFFMGGLTKYLDQKGYSKKVTGKPLASS